MEEKTNRRKLIDGSVKIKPKSEARKFLDGFIADAVPSIISYLVNDIFIPYIERCVRGAADTAARRFGGEYDELYDSTGYRRYSRRSDDRGRKRYVHDGDAFGLDNIIFKSRLDAQRVLDGLEDQIKRYDGVASVADLYEMLDEDCPYTGNRYGWTSMRGARIQLVSDGYLLKLPRALPID